MKEWERGILGVCIPTYNRSVLLEESLATTISSIKHRRVPIYISDNNSQDDTGRVIDIAKEAYPSIYANRNIVNVGPEKNFEIVLKRCREKYCWLLGDDDYIGEGFENFYKQLENNADAYVITRTNRIKPGYYTISEIFPEIIGEVLWMSSLIFSRDIIQGTHYEKYLDTEYPHSGILLDYLINNPNSVVGVVYNKSLVGELRPGYCAFEKRAPEVMLVSLSAMIERLPLLESEIEETKKSVMKEMFTIRGGMSCLVLFSLREKGSLNFSQVKSLKKYVMPYSRVHYYVMICISIIPEFLLKIARVCFDKLRPTRKR